MLTGTLPRTGRLVDVMSYCFRHEPSEDAGRMQMFRMHEHVRAAEPETVIAWREMWLGRVEWLVDALGLDTRADVAADPFFGRGGTLLAESQRDQRLKLEIVTPIASDDSPSAIISLNYHQDHFGGLFGITTADGAVAHTSCIGFGLERMTLALYRRHGLTRSRWTSPVREALDL
jgi:seryl-tRNA synthetase